MGEDMDHSLVNSQPIAPLYCRTQMYLSTEVEDTVIPLLSDAGTIIYFSSPTPTEKEL